MWNVPVASNLAAADLMISSPLLAAGYRHVRPAMQPTTWDTHPDAA